MAKSTKRFKIFKFPLDINTFRKKNQSYPGNPETCSFASSFLFQNAYNNGLIPTYFIADSELIDFFINSFNNSDKEILNNLFAKLLNYQDRSMDKDILPQISGVLTFPESMKYSPILYFIEYSILEKKIQFGIEINKVALTFSDYNKIDLIPGMTEGDKKYVDLLLGFLLYKEVFPQSVKSGLLWNIPKFTDSRQSFISVVSDKKLKEVFKKRKNEVPSQLRAGYYRKSTSEELRKKMGQIIYVPPADRHTP